jgi:hypothetical protein
LKETLEFSSQNSAHIVNPCVPAPCSTAEVVPSTLLPGSEFDPSPLGHEPVRDLAEVKDTASAPHGQKKTATTQIIQSLFLSNPFLDPCVPASFHRFHDQAEKIWCCLVSAPSDLQKAATLLIHTHIVLDNLLITFPLAPRGGCDGDTRAKAEIMQFDLYTTANCYWYLRPI